MANRERGEVSLEVGGRIYTLRPTLNACCAVEELVNPTGGDRSFADVELSAGRGSARDIRLIVWAALQESHAEEFQRPEQAGALVDEVGMGTVIATLGEMAKANSQAQTEENPQKAQVRKRGARSSLRRVGPA